MTTYTQKRLEEFNEEFVIKHIDQDYHNPPVLYNTKFEKVDEIRKFLSESIEQAVDQGMVQAKKEFEDLAKSNP